MLKVHNISKSYGSAEVLKEVSFTLSRGEIVGLLGRNGAGKSTLLKILSGINLPDKGSIEKEEARVAFLSEDNPIYPYMYVREYLTWVAKVKKVDDIPSRRLWAIRKVGLGDVLSKRVEHLSKGYRQRLGLAATLLSDPDIIILDEPINGLDPVQITEYRSLIKSIAEDKAIILSSHLLQEIDALCDRILVIRDGQITAGPALKDQNRIYLKIEVDGTLDTTPFLEIDGVEDMQKISDLIYRIGVDGQDDVRPQIFDQIVAQERKILELRKENISLDQILN